MDARMVNCLADAWADTHGTGDVVRALRSYASLLAAVEGSSNEVVRELREAIDYIAVYGQFSAAPETMKRARARIAAQEAENNESARLLGEEMVASALLRSELASVKAAYKELARHIERIAVRAENLEYECGQVVSGVSELNDAVAAYRAAHPRTP